MNVRNYLGKTFDKKVNGGSTCSKDRIFVRDAKTLVQTLDKMNNTRPIIKIFLFPYAEHTKHIFSSNFANFFYFCPHTKMLDTPKWFSNCESVNSVVSINITREQKQKKKLSKGLKK